MRGLLHQQAHVGVVGAAGASPVLPQPLFCILFVHVSSTPHLLMLRLLAVLLAVPRVVCTVGCSGCFYPLKPASEGGFCKGWVPPLGLRMDVVGVLAAGKRATGDGASLLCKCAGCCHWSGCVSPLPQKPIGASDRQVMAGK